MRATNPALIRLVGSRYGEMKGLRTIGDAGFLVTGARREDAVTSEEPTR